MTENLYIFSGLGVDERVFQKLDFSDFSVTFIKWIIPQDKETIEHYTTRLLEQIKTPNPTFIGLSFGGMIAIEVAKQIETEKIILIASAKTKKEIPFYYRFAGKLKLHKFMPARILKSSNFIVNWFFGANLTLDKQILKQILIDTNSTYLKWAIDKIVNWKNETLIDDTYHIHGTKDRVLPFRYVDCDKEIEKGGHLMVLNKSEELIGVLSDQLIMN